MGVAEDIVAARIYGAVECGMSARGAKTVPELAREFGLHGELSCYKEIDETAARHLVWRVLHRDMAYNTEIMPDARAAELTDRFLAQFGPGTRYFTNGTWHLLPVAEAGTVIAGASWDPVTDATFDTGVLAISPECSGCLWVMDED